MSVANKWPVVPLSTLAAATKGSIAGGPFGSDLVSRDYVASGVPVVRGVNLPSHVKFSFNDLVFVTENKADTLHLNCAHPGDLVFTQRGTLGQVGLLPKRSPYSRFLISQSQMKMTVDRKRADPLYLYYYFRLPSTVTYIENHALQSGVPHINLGILKKLQVICPSLNAQKKIAAILSAYDDLIENNRRRIALLEKMAEEIYREWFVRMRFPGHEQAKFEKGVPVEWQYVELRKACSLIKRGITPNYSNSAKTLIVNQRCIRQGVVDLEEARPHETKIPAEKLIQYGDVLVNSTGVGTLGRVAVFNHEDTDVTCDTHVTICRANTSITNFYYLGYTVKSLQTYFENMAVGSTGQAELGRDLIGATKILLPCPEIQRSFGNVVTPVWQSKRLLSRELKTLEKTRNALLPRLISGKLPVEALDIRFPPSMEEAAHEI